MITEQRTVPATHTKLTKQNIEYGKKQEEGEEN